jgi:peptide/nickel transport system substrate-binding protein
VRAWRTVFVGVLAGCLVSVAGVAHGQAVKNPDTLIIQWPWDPTTLDPAVAFDAPTSGVFLWSVYETLIFFNGVRTDLYVPMLATEVPSIANGGISRTGGPTRLLAAPGTSPADRIHENRRVHPPASRPAKW